MDRDPSDIWGPILMACALLALMIDRVFDRFGDGSDYVFWLSLAVLAYAAAVEWKRTQ